MENDDNFFQIFEASPVPIVILTPLPDIYIKHANAAYIALTGRKREEIVGSAYFANTPHPGMHLDIPGFDDVRQSIEKVCAEKITVKTPLQKFLKPILKSNNLETLYLEATNTPILNSEGEIKFIVRTLQNVTDLIVTAEKEKLKEKQLIENERFLSETQKVAKIGSWEMDSERRFHWSDIHYEIMEVEPGKEITVEFGIALLKEEKDRKIFAEVYKNAVATGACFDVELNIVTPKGNERWIRFTGKGELKDGVFIRMYGIGQDITEQKILQYDLMDSRNKLQAIIQTVDGVVFECDAQTLKFNFVSEQTERLLGYTPQECIHQPNFFNNLLHPDDKEDVLNLITLKLNTHKSYSRDYRIRRKDGELRWMNVSISVITENGAPKWLRGLMMDITASKQLSELELIEKKVLELNVDPCATTIDVLNTYLEGVGSVFPEMRCSIMQVANGRLHNWVAKSLPENYLAAIDQLIIADNTGSCGTAAFKNQTVIVSDIANDQRWINHKKIALKYKLLSCWSQPLKNAAGEVIATLGLYYSSIKSPTTEELKIVDRTVHLLQVILQDRQNAELLAEANLLMEQSQELANFGSLQYDLPTRQLTLSKELHNIFGIDKSTMPTADLESVIQNFLTKKGDSVIEERITRPNGEVRYLRVWGKIKTNDQGEIIKIMSAYLDITENKKIQEDLLASESRLRSLVDSQTNYVIRIDFDEKYSYANQKYLEDFGPPVGQSLIGTNALALVLPNERQKIKKISKKCIASPNVVFEVELEKFGRDKIVKHTFWHFVCLTNSKGEPKEIQCIGIDISDLKAAENEREKKTIELEQSEKRYSDLFHLSPQPMWVYDPDSLQFLDVNNAAIEQYGYLRKEFLSMTLRDIRPVEYLPELEHAIKSRNKHKDFFQGIFTHRLKNNELIKVDLKRNKIPFKGKIAHLALAINITEPLKYVEALEIQNTRLAEIAWIQSHIVRAPLSRIMGLINILQNHKNDKTEQNFILDGIVSSAVELDGIIGDIAVKAEQIQINQLKP